MAIEGLAEIKNVHVEPMVLEAIRHLATVPFLRVIIPPGESTDVYYSDLHIDENPDRPVIVAVSVEHASAEEKKCMIIPPVLIRDSAKLVLNFENGKVTVLAVKGNILARISFIAKLRRRLT